MSDDIPLLDTVDLEILMHRDAHFGGNFDVMLDYYREDGVGAMPDFEISRIRELRDIEKTTDKNLSDVMLPVPAKESIERARALYKDLRAVYEEKEPSPLSVLLSDLILAEEDPPQKEIQALAAEKAVRPLIDLVKSSTFYDPLAPGYGRAPILAALVLKEIGDTQAIRPLFEALGQDNFFTDEALIDALVSFGEKTKKEMLNIIEKKPLSKDNDHAAIVLSSLPEDPEIAKRALSLLSDPDVQKRVTLANYLIFLCAILEEDQDRKAFHNLLENKDLHEDLQFEIKALTKMWSK